MAAPESILNLVERFELHLEAYRSGKYNETQLRRDFLDPLWEALGWDVHNEQGFAEAYRDVIHEDAITVGGEDTGRADGPRPADRRGRRPYRPARLRTLRPDRTGDPDRRDRHVSHGPPGGIVSARTKSPGGRLYNSRPDNILKFCERPQNCAHVCTIGPYAAKEVFAKLRLRGRNHRARNYITSGLTIA